MVKNAPTNTGNMRWRFSPWVGKIPWRRAWQSLLYSCLENSMDRGAYSPWDCEEWDTTEETYTHKHTHTHIVKLHLLCCVLYPYDLNLKFVTFDPLSTFCPYPALHSGNHNRLYFFKH